VRNHWGGEQTWKPEHERMVSAPKESFHRLLMPSQAKKWVVL
jgi:hypothetical protein